MNSKKITFFQVFLPLIRRCKGRIILVSSILARIPSPIRGIQCANGVSNF